MSAESAEGFGRRLAAELQPDVEARGRAFVAMMMLVADAGTMDKEESDIFDAGLMAGMACTMEALRDRDWLRIPTEHLP